MESKGALESFYLKDFDVSTSKNLTENNVKDNFANFISSLRSGDTTVLYSSVGRDFTTHGGLSLLLTSSTQYSVNDVIKIPDLVGNATRGKGLFDDKDLCLLILKSFSFAFVIREKDEKYQQYHQFSSLLYGIVLHYSRHYDLFPPFWTFLNEFRLPLNHLISSLSEDSKKITILRSLLPFLSSSYSSSSSSSSEDLRRICGFESSSLLRKILWTQRAFFDSQTLMFLICHLSRESKDEMMEILFHFLKLWADPNISRGDVCREIIQISSLTLSSFLHSSSTSIQSSEMEILSHLSKGVPLHFDSTDLRILQLASFMTEFMSESLAVINEKKTKLPSTLFSRSDDLSQKLLLQIQPCCSLTSSFLSTYKDELKFQNLKSSLKEDEEEEEIKEENENEEYDEDDLEPIETLEAPEKLSLFYIRDFLEIFYEHKDKAEEISRALKSLERIIEIQIKYEDESLSLQVLKLLLDWTPDFEDHIIQKIQINILVSIVSSVPQSVLPELLRTFHSSLTLDIKNKILEVLMSSLKKIPVKNLSYVASTVFNLLVVAPNVLEVQAPSLKIPFLLFLAYLIGSLPPYLIKSEYITSFLNVILELKDVSFHMKQSIQCAIHHVVSAIDSDQIRECSESLALAKTWLLQHY